MKKVKYLALAVLIVFVLIGASYAMWTDSIFIDGKVETGDIDVKWVQIKPEAQWHYSMYTDPGPDRDDFWKADLVADYNYSEDVGISVDGKTLRLKLYKTIPELIVRKLVDVTNFGTAPVALDTIWFTDDDGPPKVATVHPVDGFVVDGAGTQVRFSVHDTGAGWVYIAPGMELAAGETKEFAISVHTLPTADMNQHLEYELELEWKLIDPSLP